jgi:hypothetical protein
MIKKTIDLLLIILDGTTNAQSKKIKSFLMVI